MSDLHKTLTMATCIAVSGFAAILLSAGNGNVLLYQASMFPFLRNAIENMQLASVTFLCFTIGFMAGWLLPSKAIKLSFVAMSVPVTLTFIEVAAKPKTHSLLPIELSVYAVLTLCCVFGAFCSIKMRGTGGIAPRQTQIRRKSDEQ